MSDLSAELARSHVEKIVASDGFAGSDRLCRFLRFTVDAKLRGEGGQIKEYLLGREVFDRNDDYDPRLDPIVRVEARRLRKKLEEYYAGPGREDAIRVDFPKGSYAPEFHSVAAAPVTRSRWWLAAPALFFASIAAGVYLRPHTAGADAVAVIPARWVWAQEAFPNTPQDVDLAERVAAELANRHIANVAAWPTLQRFRDGAWTTDRIAREVGAGRVLVVAVRQETAGLRVTTYLIDGKNGHKLRVTDKQSQQLDSAESRESVAREIASTFRQ